MRILKPMMRNSKTLLQNSLIALAALLLIENTVSRSSAATVLPGAQFYISPTGNDAGNGSFEQPFETLERAREATRRVDRKQEGKIEIILREGI